MAPKLSEANCSRVDTRMESFIILPRDPYICIQSQRVQELLHSERRMWTWLQQESIEACRRNWHWRMMHTESLKEIHELDQANFVVHLHFGAIVVPITLVIATRQIVFV